jgi:hypothetical protein
MAAEIIHRPQNNSVMFVKQSDIVVTSDYWKVIINFDLSPYEIAINMVRNQLTELTNTTRYPSQVVEVQQIHFALETLEGRLQTLRYFSPKPEQKR